jgi:hypothetical protein
MEIFQLFNCHGRAIVSAAGNPQVLVGSQHKGGNIYIAEPTNICDVILQKIIITSRQMKVISLLWNHSKCTYDYENGVTVAYLYSDPSAKYAP